MITEFITSVLINWVIASVSLFAAYAVAAAALLNLNHGCITEWQNRLALLAMRLPKDKVELVGDVAVVKAPLSEASLEDLRAFVGNHRLVDKAERRLLLIRSRGRILSLALLLGLVFGVGFSAPLLFGLPSLVVTYPALIATISAVGLIGTLFMFNFPHGLDWGRLKDATGGVSA